MAEGLSGSAGRTGGAQLAVRLAGIPLLLTGLQFLAVALLVRGGAMGSMLALGAAFVALGLLCRRGNAAALAPGLLLSLLLVGLAVLRRSVLIAAAGPWFWAGLGLPALSLVFCLAAAAAWLRR